MSNYDQTGFEPGFHDGHARLEDESVSELIKEASYHAKTLIRGELDVAKKELQDAAKASAQAGAIFGAGAFIGSVGFMAVTACFILAIAGGLPAWLSALIVGVVYLIAAGACFFIARARFQKLEVPRTRRHLQEDKQWLQTTVERVKSPSRVNA